MKIIGVKHALAVTGVMSGIIAGVFAAMPTANASGGDEVRYLTDVKEGTFYGSPQAQSVWPGDDVILQAGWRVCLFWESAERQGWTINQAGHGAHDVAKSATGWTVNWDIAQIQTSAPLDLCPRYWEASHTYARTGTPR